MSSKDGEGLGDGRATTRYTISKSLPEKRRLEIASETVARAAECYFIAKSKIPQLQECLRDLVVKWDDALECGEFSGDAALTWREEHYRSELR